MSEVTVKDYISVMESMASANIPCPPVDMVLYCPRCGHQHIDEAKDEWKNPPHRSHLCGNPKCKCVWRPADIYTNGVLKTKTSSPRDTWP